VPVVRIKVEPKLLGTYVIGILYDLPSAFLMLKKNGTIDVLPSTGLATLCEKSGTPTVLATAKDR
jgi:hypothetical protein